MVQLRVAAQGDGAALAAGDPVGDRDGARRGAAARGGRHDRGRDGDRLARDVGREVGRGGGRRVGLVDRDLGRARGAVEVGVARVGAGEGVVARGGLDDGAGPVPTPRVMVQLWPPVTPSVTVTVPVGVPVAGATGVTVAVTVIVWPET